MKATKIMRAILPRFSFGNRNKVLIILLPPQSSDAERGFLRSVMALALVAGLWIAISLGPTQATAAVALTPTGQWPGWPRGYALRVAASGNYAYVAAVEGSLQVIDVSDPAHPQQVGGYDTSGYAYGVAVSGNYAYVADGSKWTGCNYVGSFQVIDVSDPANPQRVGGCDTSRYARGVAVSGNYAYVADGDAGLEVIDVSNPANPQRVGGYDTSGSARGVAVLAGMIYVADGLWGLQILEQHGLAPLRLDRLPDGSLRIQWTGEAPPYQLQSRTNLSAGNWQDEGAPTDQTGATVQSDGTAKFFRVLSQ